jgi:Domain of unknown function (DUF397)
VTCDQFSTVIKEKVIEMQATDLSGAVWRRSSHSGGDNGSQCVELALLAGTGAVRDSKAGWDPELRAAPALVFPVRTMTAFVAAAKLGRLDQH